MSLNKYLIVFSLVTVIFTSCKKSLQNTEGRLIGDAQKVHADDLPPSDNTVPTVNIIWDEASTRKVSHDVYFADYGRVHRAPNGTLVMTYGCGPDANRTRIDVIIRRSTDNGLTWSAPQTVISGIGQANYTGFANPEMLVMQNGWLMLAYEGKGNPDDNAHDNIQFCISKDNGVTWSAPKIVASGRSWEPGMIQLPDGEIEMFWSSEAKWWPSSDVQQEILMSRSKDNGNTWTIPFTVAYASGKRDGMPTPVILNDNKGMIFTIESIRDNKSPYVLWSSMSARWNYKNFGTLENGRRWLATTDNIFGAAPHIIQLKTGETLISVHADDGRNVSNFQKQTMLMYRGNSMAGSARRINEPWNVPTNEGAYYSMLFLKDASHVVMVTTRNMADGHSEVWWKEGRLVHNYPKANWSIKEFSSEDPSNSRIASKLIDDDISTWWIARYSTNPTNYPNHYVTIDMGAQLNVDGFSAVQKTGDRKIKTLEILISDNNTAWQTLGTFTLQNKELKEQLIQLPASVSCRYFKLVPKSGYDSQPQPSLAEIGAYKLD